MEESENQYIKYMSQFVYLCTQLSPLQLYFSEEKIQIDDISEQVAEQNVWT